MGNGYGFSKQFQQMSAQELGGQIKKVSQSTAMLSRAKEVQAEVLEENGNRAVVSIIKENWARSA
jgi:UDP:flavonoid glycosyltransferase YjiC (YdhE family)